MFKNYDHLTGTQLPSNDLSRHTAHTERNWVKGDNRNSASIDHERKTPWFYGILNLVFPGLGLFFVDRIALGTAFVAGTLILILLTGTGAIPAFPFLGMIITVASAQLSLQAAKQWNEAHGYH